MTPRQPLPAIWLISDARNDAALDRALRELPRGSGFVFRHYHLTEPARQERFAALAALGRELGHVVILSGDAATATAWGADGTYGPPDQLSVQPGLLRLATAHDRHEIEQANRAGADGIFLSPVFPTRSHPAAPTLGIAGFQALAALAHSPVIALGGMNPARAAALNWPHWAAIDAFAAD